MSLHITLGELVAARDSLLTSVRNGAPGYAKYCDSRVDHIDRLIDEAIGYQEETP